jgi:hypothetical protein
MCVRTSRNHHFLITTFYTFAKMWQCIATKLLLLFGKMEWRGNKIFYICGNFFGKKKWCFLWQWRQRWVIGLARNWKILDSIRWQTFTTEFCYCRYYMNDRRDKLQAQIGFYCSLSIWNHLWLNYPLLDSSNLRSAKISNSKSLMWLF